LEEEGISGKVLERGAICRRSLQETPDDLCQPVMPEIFVLREAIVIVEHDVVNVEGQSLMFGKRKLTHSEVV
jgi:hypothetical protein